MRHVLTTGSDLKQINGRLFELTKEQYEVLEDVQDERGDLRNDRVLIQGGAGTGKTMLALQLARLRHMVGDRVLLACHGGLIVDWLRVQLPNITVLRPSGSQIELIFGEVPGWPNFVQEYLRDVAQLDGQSERYELQSLYRERLQQYWRPWDYLIVDELQYYVDKVAFDLLDLALQNGLIGGRWTMFGDFAFQDWLLGEPESYLMRSDDRTVFARDTPESVHPLAYLRALCHGTGSGKGWFEPRPLKLNCRNAEPIAKASARIVGQDNVGVRASDVSGPAVTYRYWNDFDRLHTLMGEACGELNREGIRPDQVVVLLGFIGDHDLDALVRARGRACGPWRLWVNWQLSEFDETTGEVRFLPTDELPAPPEARHRLQVRGHGEFIGMESDVVVLVLGVDDHGTQLPLSRRKFVYSCMTRAKAALIVLAQEGLRDTFEPSGGASESAA